MSDGAQKNLNVAILAQLYHAPGMGHRTHPGSEFQRENLCVNGVLLIWIRRNQMKYLPLAKELVGQGPCQIKLYYSSLYCRITHYDSHRAKLSGVELVLMRMDKLFTIMDFRNVTEKFGLYVKYSG